MHNSHDDKSANSLSERREPTFGALNEHPNTSGSTGQVSGNGVGHFSAIDDFDPLHPNKPNPAVPPMPRFDASQEPAKPGAAAPAASQPPQTQVPPQPTSQPQASKSEPAPQATELHLRAAAQQSARVVQPNNASAAAQSDATSAPTGAHVGRAAQPDHAATQTGAPAAAPTVDLTGQPDNAAASAVGSASAASAGATAATEAQATSAPESQGVGAQDKSAGFAPDADASASADTAAASGTDNQDEEPEGNFLYRWREQYRARKAALAQEKADRKAGLLPKRTLWQKIVYGTKYFTALMLKLTIVGLGFAGLLFIYFDAVVVDDYEIDDRWVLPAVVYSRPLELYPDQRLSLDQMVYELNLLQYREVSSPRKSGEYALNRDNGRIVLIKRPFSFPDGDEPKMSVLVEFEDKRVKRIVNADTMQDLAYMRMDPVLLDRINRINPAEDRIFITLDEVPEELITTLIEVEDRAYFQHFGINPIAIGRAFVKNFLAGRVVEGGSTITQQLVKNYFFTNERSYERKLKEIFMAISMNHRYSKEQVLEAYMNEIYLGQNGNAGIYGFGLASYFYFGVPVAELNLEQMALLVGLIKGPSYYDPWRFPERALERRNTVLGVLRNRGHISVEKFEELAAKPIEVIPRGKLTYRKTPAFMGLVKTEIGERFKEEEERTGKDFLSGNGIKIFTSLDPQAQIAAEKAVTQEIAAIEKERKLKDLQAAMVVSSWRTGEVSAVVGSSEPNYDGYNRALDSHRQVGSLIKPFVYLTAFHQGYHLGSIVNDSPVQVKLPNGDIWAPQNDDKKFRGPIRVIRAMASSLNVPTVRVGMGAGLDNVVNTIKAAGYKHDIPLYPSIVLGTPEFSPYELNSLYVGMATEGIYRDLTTLRTIVKNGEIVYQRGSNRSPRSLDPKDTYLAIYGMTEATRSGTGRRIGNMFPDVTIASKTGTTNDNRDSWTVGMDSDEITTIWVGNDQNKSTGLYGSSGAMRLYGAYLQERGVNSLELKRPQGVIYVNFDRAGNVLANGCEEDGMERYPAREDRIQYIRQCNNFGEPGYQELPYVDPNADQLREQAQGQWGNAQGIYQGIAPQTRGMVPNQGQSGAGQPGGQPGGQYGQPAAGQNFGSSGFVPAQPGSLWNRPNTDALQDSRVEDSGAQDYDPVVPDENARPAQSSSSNVERQADSFEDELLGIF